MTEQAIDWPGIRAAAVLVGVREAARQAAADLPPDEVERFTERVMKRSSREGWLDHKSATVSAVVPMQAKTLSAPVRNGARTAHSALESYQKGGKLALAKTVKKTAVHLSRMKPDQLVERVPAIAGLATAHAKLFPEQTATGPLVSIQLLTAPIVEHAGTTNARAVEHAPTLDLPE